MVDLSTTYLGLSLKNPLMAGASPLSKKLDSIRRLEDSGVSAVTMYSLFEEQVVEESKALDFYLSYGTESFAEALTYFPEMDHYNVGPDEYLSLISGAKKAVQIPVIGSLNGVSSSGWVEMAKQIQQAGADALELNIYHIPTDIKMTSQDLEQIYINLVSEVRKQIHIPLAVKLNPFISSLPNFASRLVKAGANGLVMFNRFYQPDLDIEELEVVPRLELSTSADLLLPLRWTAILFGRVEVDFALTGGVHSASDIAKAVMSGANAVQTVSELVQKGVGRAGEMVKELERWMIDFEYTSIQQMRGSMSQKTVAEPGAFERANYMKALTSYDKRM